MGDLNNLILKAERLYNRKKYLRAIREYDKCLLLDKKNQRCLIGLAKSYNQIGDHEKVINILAVKQEENVELYDNLFFAYNQTSRAEEMSSVFEKYLNIFKIKTNKIKYKDLILDSNGECYFVLQTKNIKKNESGIDAFIRINGPSKFINLNIFTCLSFITVDDQKSRLSMLKKITENYPNLSNATLEIAKIYSKDPQKIKKAESSCKELINTNPNYKFAYIELGKILIKLNKIDEAITILQESLNVKFDFENIVGVDFIHFINCGIYYYIAKAFYKTKRFSEAYQYVRKSLSSHYEREKRMNLYAKVKKSLNVFKER